MTVRSTVVGDEPRPITWQLTRRDDVARLHIAGEVDVAAAPKLDEALQAISQPVGVVVIHLGEVTFLDGSGLRALVDLARALEDLGVIVRFRYASPSVVRYLDLTRATLTRA